MRASVRDCCPSAKGTSARLSPCSNVALAPATAPDATDQNIMGHDAGPQGMPSAALVHRRALRTCRQLKGGVWPTPTYSYKRGERNAGMRDSLADEAIAPR